MAVADAVLLVPLDEVAEVVFLAAGLPAVPVAAFFVAVVPADFDVEVLPDFVDGAVFAAVFAAEAVLDVEALFVEDAVLVVEAAFVVLAAVPEDGFADDVFFVVVAVVLPVPAAFFLTVLVPAALDFAPFEAVEDDFFEPDAEDFFALGDEAFLVCFSISCL